MSKTKRITVAMMLLVMIVSMSGCTVIDFFSELFDPTLEIIRGRKVISGEGEVYIIPKGTTVKFKSTWLSEIEGELIIKDGAKLIAQGTADEPIIFQEGSDETGGIIELQATASNDSVVEYCYFKESTRLNIYNSISVTYNKFFSSGINCYAATTIEYNNFDGNSYSNAISSEVGTTANPIIRYNNISNCYSHGIKLFAGNNPQISLNNITECIYKAIYWGNSSDPESELTVSNNYIADNDSQSGYDSSGEQCFNVIYETYKSSFVVEAGCGW